MIDIIVPDGVSDAAVVEILEQVGAEVREEASLLAIETDKATAEIPAPVAGKIIELSVKIGDSVSSGDVIGKLEEASPQKAEQVVVPPLEQSPPSTEQTASQAPQTEQTAEQTIDIIVPEGVADATVVEIMQEAGAEVQEEESLIAIETDKATAEVPAPSAGKIIELSIKIGENVSSGDVIGKLAVLTASLPSSESPKNIEEAPKAEAPVEQASGTAILTNSQTLGAGVHASPSVRQMARELGVDLSLVKKPTGPKGRITFADVKGFVKSAMQGAKGSAKGGTGSIPSIDLPDFSQFGPTEEQPLSKIKQVTGQHLLKGWLNIPLVTHFEETDITELESFRKVLNSRAKVGRGVTKGDLPKTTALAFIVKSVVKALQQYPQVNSSLSADGKSLTLKNYYNIGIAVDTPKGLLVPVIQGADRLSIDEISERIVDFGSRGRAGKLSPKDMQGGSFTISSLGGLGGTNFTPLVNPPEAAILGVAKAAMKPVWNGSDFVPRLILPFSISYDHRILDGGEVARFGSSLASYLNDLRNILI